MTLITKPRILIIDDDAMLREILAYAISEGGYEPIEAANGEQGIGLALRSHPNLILCDLFMPGVDGFGVLVRLRADPVTAGIPFVFLTSSADIEDSRLGLLLGANDYVSKPIDNAMLMALIEKRLGAA